MYAFARDHTPTAVGEPSNGTVLEVQEFLRSRTFSGYQAVPLPGGLKLPGKLQARRADYILDNRVRNKSVLEVGTYYGYFPYAAMERGARSATGLEPDAERAAVAREVARLNGNRYTIVEGSLDSFQPPEPFDVVLFLRVMHHITDPVRVMTQLAALTRELLIVEFSLASDPQYLRSLYAARGRKGGVWANARAQLASWLLRTVVGDLPLMAVGNQPYDRTFYFSRQAFYNLFVTHLGLFSDITFLPGSVGHRRHCLALCRPASPR